MLECFVTAALLLAGGEFAKYPAEHRLAGKPASPSIATAKARQFRTVLRRAAAQGPNFNGHYRVAHWGQGSNVIEWAVIDLANGRVWIAPEPAGSCWAQGASEEVVVPDWYEVHVDSALLYLHGCLSAEPAARVFDTRFVYVWEQGAPRLLRTEKLR
jgi:hypothetical protein